MSITDEQIYALCKTLAFIVLAMTSGFVLIAGHETAALGFIILAIMVVTG